MSRPRVNPRPALAPLGVGAAALLSLASSVGAPGGAPAMSADAAAAGAIECDPENGGITLAEGLCALVFADDLGRARHLAVRDNGDVYVMLREPVDGKGVVALRDTTGDGRADVVERFGDFAGTGIGIRGGHLYVAPNDRVLRYALGDEGELVPGGEPEVVAHGFPEQRGHAAKPFALDGDGHIYVNVGAPSNSCETELRTAGSPGQDPCPELERQAGIWRFAADELDQTQGEHGERYANGIRNAVALDWNAAVGELYAVQHGRDQLDAFWPDFYDEEQNAELPSEEFLRVEAGTTFAWPYCYHDPHRGHRVLAPEYGGDGEEVGRCDRFPEPITTFPAPWAPNDLLFYTGDLLGERYRGGAFVAFHGSWNRAPLEQRGYKVAFVPFDGARPSGDWEVFADGFAGEGPIRASDEAEHRPMGLAAGPDGSLYISDSQRGRIWRVVRASP